MLSHLSEIHSARSHPRKTAFYISADQHFSLSEHDVA
jgi:hypothetical protein